MDLRLILLAATVVVLWLPGNCSTESIETTTIDDPTTIVEFVSRNRIQPRLLDTSGFVSNDGWIPVTTFPTTFFGPTTTATTRRRTRPRKPTTRATTVSVVAVSNVAAATPSTTANDVVVQNFPEATTPTTFPKLTVTPTSNTTKRIATINVLSMPGRPTTTTTTTTTTSTTELPRPTTDTTIEDVVGLTELSSNSAVEEPLGPTTVSTEAYGSNNSSSDNSTLLLDDLGNALEREATIEFSDQTVVDLPTTSESSSTTFDSQQLTTVPNTPTTTSNIPATIKADRSSPFPSGTSPSVATTSSVAAATTAAARNTTQLLRAPTEEPHVSVNSGDTHQATTLGVHGVNDVTVVAVSVSVVVAVLAAVIAAVVLVVVRRKRAQGTCKPVRKAENYSLDNVSPSQTWLRGNKLRSTLRSSKRSYSNQAFEDPVAVSNPLSAAQLSLFVEKSPSLMEEEFHKIPASPTVRLEELPQGSEMKNRYANVLPIPETRVRIRTPEDNNGGDDTDDQYINANYVQGLKGEPRCYIACQAPIDSTVTDFWQMVWENQSQVIIQLTALSENMVTKCAEYLPPSEVLDCQRLHGQYQVTMTSRELRDDYVVSRLKLKRADEDLVRDVVHFWYSWPTNGVPQQVRPIVNLLKEACRGDKTKDEAGPMIVHCSPGTGRTGTVIAVDVLMKQLDFTKTVDIPRCVYRLRRDRAGCVQTKEQYSFIYKAVDHYATQISNGTLDSL